MDKPLVLWSQPRTTLVSEPSFTEPAHLGVEWVDPSDDGSRLVEYAGRLCYMSQANPAHRTSRQYIENIFKQAHGSVAEHANYSILVEGVSRSLTHELVRHRAGFAYSQLSQRYVDESDVGFVVPPALLGLTDLLPAWEAQMHAARVAYQVLSDALYKGYDTIEDKVHRRKTAREAARSVLPNATETKVVITGNVRAWRHFLQLRGSAGAEREIRRLAVVLLGVLTEASPLLFQDFTVHLGEDGLPELHSIYLKV